MNQFSISQLAQFSGIKAHTIRMWEQRYNALQPNRSEGNTRYYDNAQLRRLLNIVSLMRGDYKVSELCVLDDERLFKMVGEFKSIGTNDEADDYFVSQLISAGMSYDAPLFGKIFSQSIRRYGMKETYLRVIYPMLVRIGIMWSGDAMPPAPEHFISNLVRQKLFSAIDSLPNERSASDSWLLFLPENELHEIGLLFAHYLIRLSGRKVVYLGSNVPLESLSLAIAETLPANLLLFLAHRDLPATVQEYLENLENQFMGKNIFVAGEKEFTDQLKGGKKIHFLSTVDDLEKQLTIKQAVKLNGNISKKD